ncbi:MAG: HAD hydrolase family protein [Anaerolineales bacterium]|nr:HAD hydrolase family protein [Anaerolineales bacterium]
MNLRSTLDASRLLVVDMQGVLIGGADEGRQRLQQALQQIRKSILLVYFSGQDLATQIEQIEQNELLWPDYVISSVGTEIHRLPGEYPLKEWFRYIQAGFSRQAIVDFLAATYPQLELQAPAYQTPLKVSYNFKNAPAEALDKLYQALLEAQLPIKLVYSFDLYLDVIPERAGIGPAVQFLKDSLALSPNQIFVAGHSGNHIDLFQYGFRGIVVGNATRRLKEAVQLQAYFSHTSHAEGLFEGLDHYHFFGPPPSAATPDLTRIALEQAVSSLRRNITPMGFSAASLTDNALTDSDSNYFAVWSRDGIKTGLWSLGLNDPELTACFRHTLELLAEHQTESGQIPANVQIETRRPDYGGIGDIASIDSVLWFVIGGCRFAAYTGDRAFLTRLYPHLKRAMQWLIAHDSNNCGLIEIPESSDWMDLFPRSYNVLYDEVLWYLACRDFSVATAVMAENAQTYLELTARIRRKIIRQFWPTSKKLSDARESFAETQFSLGNAKYMLAQISPFGFSWRCDIYANLMAALVGLLDEHQMEQLFHFLWGVGSNVPYPVKCLYPTIHSGAGDWKDYFVTNLLNLPDHYHNGGIWPFIGGLWVRFLAQLGRTELAHRELNALAEACRLGLYQEWEFNEWLHGLTGRPMGKAHQSWTAASYVAAYQALHHEQVAADFEPLTESMFVSPERKE